MPLGQHNWDPDAPDPDNLVIPMAARDQAPAAPSALERLVGSQNYWDTRHIPIYDDMVEIRWRAPVQRVVIVGYNPMVLSFDRTVSLSANGYDAVHFGGGMTVLPCRSHTVCRIVALLGWTSPEHKILPDELTWNETLHSITGHGGAYALVPDVGYHAAAGDWDDDTSCPST